MKVDVLKSDTDTSVSYIVDDVVIVTTPLNVIKEFVCCQNQLQKVRHIFLLELDKNNLAGFELILFLHRLAGTAEQLVVYAVPEFINRYEELSASNSEKEMVLEFSFVPVKSKIVLPNICSGIIEMDSEGLIAYSSRDQVAFTLGKVEENSFVDFRQTVNIIDDCENNIESFCGIKGSWAPNETENLHPR